MGSRLLWLTLTLFWYFPLMRAQTQPPSDPTTEDGYKPYGSFAFGDYDSVNMENLKLDLHIPLPSFAQRGGALMLDYQLSYSSGSFTYDFVPYVPPDGCDISQCPGSDTVNFSSTGGLYIRSSFGDSGATSIGMPGYSGPTDGKIQTPNGSHVTEPAGNGTQYATDGSGYTMVPGACPALVGSQNNLVRSPAGVSTCNPTLPGGAQFDTNGNSITVGPFSAAISSVAGIELPTYLIDSVGRTIPLPPFQPGSFIPYGDAILNVLQLTSDTSGCTGASPITKAVLWKVPAPLGQTAIYKFCYAQVPVTGIVIPCSTLASITTNYALCQYDPTQFVVSPPFGMTFAGSTQTQTKATWDQVSVYLQSIVLPNHQTWTFAYDGTYGDITKITSPTGGTISYTWTTFAPYANPSCFAADAPFQFARAVATRTVDANDGTGPHTWTYTQNQLDSTNETNHFIPPYAITVSNPDGTSSVHTFGNQFTLNSTCNYYETRQIMYSAQGAPVQQIDTGYIATPSNLIAPIATAGIPLNLSVLPNTITTTEGGQVKLVEKDYDAGVPVTVLTDVYGFPNADSVARVGNVIAERTYDYSPGSHGPLLQVTGTSFLWTTDTTSSYLNAGLLNRISSYCTARTGLASCTGNSIDSRQYYTYGYDEVGSPQGVLGNQTSVNKWLDTTGGMLSTRTTYNNQGMPSTTTDAANNTTTLTYDGTGAYLRNVDKPTIAGTSHVDQYFYDLSGVLNTYIDENNQPTTYLYDVLGRVTSVTNPDGGQTTLNYNGDPVPAHVTYTRTTGTAAGPVVEDVWYDGAGRVADIDMSSDPEGVTSRKILYDPWGRVAARSNDYRSSGDATYGWTSYAYDVLGRKMLECEQDNGTGSNPCVPAASYKQWVFSGPNVTIQDEARNQTEMGYDGLARLQNVTEAGGQVTQYQYDVLGNLSTVVQNGIAGDSPRNRAFTYDSLSRLITSSNPETGVICYGHGDGTVRGCQKDGYDNNGNLIYKTDARGTVTSFSYDALDRLTYKKYSDGTETVGYGYDGRDEAGNIVSQPSANSIGRISHISNEVNAANTYSYDALGNLVLQSSCIPSDCSYNVRTSAQYDLAGNTTDLTYPSGEHIHQVFDGAGHLASSKLVDVAGLPSAISYLESAAYLPDASPQTFTLGNGVVQTIIKNNRLEVDTMTTAGPSALFNSQPFASHTYCYLNCSTGGSANNGNIWGIVDHLGAGRSQGFTYDSLNRVTSFSLGGVANQAYGIDSFGNLTQMFGPNSAYTFDPNTNRVNNLLCASSTQAYDAAGNQLCDSDQYGSITQRGFDAENRITQIATLNNSASPFVSYTYGADGDRVRKGNADGSFVDYVGFGGHPIAEKDQTGAWTDYVYVNGKKIAMVPQKENVLQVAGSYSGSWTGVGTSIAAPAMQNYTFRPGDALNVRQRKYGSNVHGGILLYGNGVGSFFYDQDGQRADDDTLGAGTWHNRVIPLDGLSGAVYTGIGIGGGTSTDYVFQFASITVSSTDGSVRTIYNGETDGPFVSVGADPNAIRFYNADHLGSTQMEFSFIGAPLSLSQFTPFGGEINPSVTTNRYKFTGKERDTESGLDYFGARYYASSMGRWMSPDWADKPEPVPYSKLANPQSLNLYSYVSNNPLNKVDLDGHCENGFTGGDYGGFLALDSCESLPNSGQSVAVKEVAQKAQAQQQSSNQVVGNTTEGSLAKVLTNEDGSLSTQKGGNPQELVDGKIALANTIYNNANLARPEKVAPDTGAASAQDGQIMQGVVKNRISGGADPVQGRVYYGTSHIPNLTSRSAGNRLRGAAGRESVFAKFGPFKDSISSQSTYIYIYNNPGH